MTNTKMEEYKRIEIINTSGKRYIYISRISADDLLDSWRIRRFFRDKSKAKVKVLPLTFEDKKYLEDKDKKYLEDIRYRDSYFHVKTESVRTKRPRKNKIAYTIEDLFKSRKSAILNSFMGEDDSYRHNIEEVANLKKLLKWDRYGSKKDKVTAVSALYRKVLPTLTHTDIMILLEQYNEKMDNRIKKNYKLDQIDDNSRLFPLSSRDKDSYYVDSTKYMEVFYKFCARKIKFLSIIGVVDRAHSVIKYNPNNPYEYPFSLTFHSNECEKRK